MYVLEPVPNIRLLGVGEYFSLDQNICGGGGGGRSIIGFVLVS